MSRRARGTYTLIDNRAAAYIKQTRDASSSVLMALVERSNYTHKAPMTTAELMIETGLMQRAVEKALARLEALGLASHSAKRWAFPRANSSASQTTNEETYEKASQDASQSASQNAYGNAYDGTQNSEENAVQNDKSDSLKEVEGSKKELKDKNTPLTPQGVPEAAEQPETDSGETLAADLRPVQDSTPTPQEPSPPKGLENVPRRRAAAPPELPGDLAALPGMPEAWTAWLKYAREVRLKITESVADAQFSKLRKLDAEGWDLPHIVQHAIENSWKSFYPIRSERPRQNLKLEPPESDPYGLARYDE